MPLRKLKSRVSMTPLTSFEQSILEQAREMKSGDPPEPWSNGICIPAAGVLACGWDGNENTILISHDGYSINETKTGKRLHRDRDHVETFEAMSSNHLRFTIPATSEQIDIFGLIAGDGIQVSEDKWELERIYPWWPRGVIIIREPYVVGSGKLKYLDRAHLLDTGRLDGWLRQGFSPSGKHFVFIGSGGAYVFSRE